VQALAPSFKAKFSPAALSPLASASLRYRSSSAHAFTHVHAGGPAGTWLCAQSVGEAGVARHLVNCRVYPVMMARRMTKRAMGVATSARAMAEMLVADRCARG